jgi:FkbM family methyltransferase
MINGKTVFCEIGVGPLAMAFSALLWDKPNIEVLMFEPHPIFYKELAEAAKNRPNVTVHNVAIGDDDGTMELFDEGTSSALADIASPVAQHFKKSPDKKKKFTVDVKRLINYDFGQIDILRLDSEGSEWFALKHMISRPRDIVVETHNDIATYINPHLYEIHEWAKANHYALVSIKAGDFIYKHK